MTFEAVRDQDQDDEETNTGATGSEAQPACNVQWRVEYEPYFGCGLMVRGIINWSFGKMLRSLQLYMQSLSKSEQPAPEK